MEGVVTFDADEWREIYPAFAYMSDARLEFFFADACLILNNTPESVVKDVALRKSLLYKLVCHFATLAERGSGTVGNITSATEGGVSGSVSSGALGANLGAAWFNQTQCGAAFWQLTKRYRAGGFYVAYQPHC